MTRNTLTTTFIALLCLTEAGFVNAQEQKRSVLDASSDAASSSPRYSIQASELFYDITAKAEFGPGSKVHYNGKLVYTLKTADNGTIAIECMSQWMSAMRSSGRYQSLVRLGPTQVIGGKVGTCSINPDGRLVELQHTTWLFGLPVDQVRFAFPELSDDKQWTSQEPVSLVGSPHGSGQVQLLPVAPEIKAARQSTYLRRSNSSGLEKISMLNTTRKVTDSSPRQLTIAETMTLDGAAFTPNVSLSGSGTVVFSRELGSVDSIKRTYNVVWKEPGVELTVPVSFELNRMASEDVEAWLAARKQAAETQKMRLEKAKALQASVPDLTDRQAVMEVLRSGDKAVFDQLIAKLYGEKAKDDLELGSVLYEQFFERDDLPYHASRVVSALAPSLEKSVALAAKYRGRYSSFDIELTGESITTETKLHRGQVVCYRNGSGSSFKSAAFYGATEDVLVLQTFDREPKLLAIKREKCRLPLESFRDLKAQAEKASE